MLKQLNMKVGVNNQNLNVSMYTCRHTVATKLGNTQGMSYPWVANRLGHSLKCLCALMCMLMKIKVRKSCIFD